jgi:hypothetical protein
LSEPASFPQGQYPFNPAVTFLIEASHHRSESDGETLIAYTDFYGIGTLYPLMLRVHGEVHSYEIDTSECHELKERTAKSIGIVATKPVGYDKRWVSMEPGELCAFRNGELVFSTEKAAASSRPKGGYD